MASPPTGQEVREALLRHAEEFSLQTGISKSEIGKRAVNDAAVLGQISAGRNFTISLYQRLMLWLDSNWPDPKQRPVTGTRNGLRKRGASSVRGHFSRFKHIRTNHFRSAAEIEAHIDKLRNEWHGR
jgi:hypothetical protein